MLQNRKGFTLIELLIVVVIIGILAAIAIPKFSSTREKAYVSAMKSDLRNLQSSQEIYYSANDPTTKLPRYVYHQTATISPGLPDAALGFAASEGVTVTISASNKGWQAEATHTATNTTCDVYVDDEATTPPVTHAKSPGVVACGVAP